MNNGQASSVERAPKSRLESGLSRLAGSGAPDDGVEVVRLRHCGPYYYYTPTTAGRELKARHRKMKTVEIRADIERIMSARTAHPNSSGLSRKR